LGTRLLPATKSQPKEMLPIVDRPAIQYVVDEAIASGVRDLLIITGRGKRSLEDHFDRSVELESFLMSKNDNEMIDVLRQISDGADIFYIRQKEAKGLGHAVSCAQKHIANEPFAVMLGDDIFVSEPPALAQMIELFQRRPGIIIAIQEVPPSQSSLYGMVAGEFISDNIFRIDDLVEKPPVDEAPSNLAIVGRYIFPPEIFQALEQTTADARGEIQLTDAIKRLRGELPIYGYRFLGKRYDIGSRLSYLTTNIELALNRPDLREDLLAFLREVVAARAV
jgi:UTP--glucose-1-phosphate uridylyltransferase